jgi:hypothetical protein
MCFGQALVTQDFSAEPALLATKRALYHKAYFADGLVAGQLPWAERLVLGGLVLDAVLDAPRFQGILVFLATIRLVGVESGVRFNAGLVDEADQGLAVVPVGRGWFQRRELSHCGRPRCAVYSQKPTSLLSSTNGPHCQHRAA